MLCCIHRNRQKYESKAEAQFERPDGIYFWNEVDEVWQRIRVWPSKDPSGLIGGFNGKLCLCKTKGREMTQTSSGRYNPAYQFI
jgi:hypothetical protein